MSLMSSASPFVILYTDKRASLHLSVSHLFSIENITATFFILQPYSNSSYWKDLLKRQSIAFLSS